MTVSLKRIIALLMVLVVQIQPLQVHAIVLDTEQDGHVPGQLLHFHHDHHDHSKSQNVEQDGSGSGTENRGQEPAHASECHPAHTLCSIIVFRTNLERSLVGVQLHPAPPLPFFEPSLELPPPKSNS